MVRNKRSKTITPTLPTNINNIISLVEDHVPSKTTPNLIIQPPIVQETPPSSDRKYSISEIALNKMEKHDRKMKRRNHRRETLAKLASQEDHFLDECITVAEDERTDMAKANTTDGRRLTIDKAHDKSNAKPTPGIKQQWMNKSYGVCSAFKRTATRLLTNKKQVTFGATISIQAVERAHEVHLTYDSGADGNYVSEKDRKIAGLPILKVSSKRVGVANGDICKAKNVTQLPFPQLSEKASRADTFDNFPTSLMSVGKTADDGTISIFTKTGVTVHKETDVLIRCKKAPILIGVRDEHGRYRIPLIQKRGQWQPQTPSKKQRRDLEMAGNVYDLPSTEQGIKWMHAVCGYPVKSTWLKAIAAGNFIGWPLLTVQNVKKYYPETTETPKGHLNQTRKNVRSTKEMEIPDASTLKGKKVRDVGIHVYNVRETIFSDQTGKYPKRSQRGNKYIMVMVEIDSNAILVEPMKSRRDEEMIRAYDALLSRLRQSGSRPRKHVLDNEVSDNMKHHIQVTCRLEMELVPPGCHRRNAAEVAIRNFKTHFLSVMAGVAEDFPENLWDRLLPQAEITLNLLRQSNSTPNVSAYAHLSGPFDYNKMPLAPMGCAAQIHEKSDKRGTWQYHTVDGWYLNTSPLHYRTHVCHIKESKKERLTDTVQFQHKRITNPTISHADKIMHAIQQVIREIKKLGGVENSQEARDLQTIVNDANDYLQNTELLETQPVPRVNHRQRTSDGDRIQERVQQSPPRVPIALPRVPSLRQLSNGDQKETSPQPEGAPASRTRSKTAHLRLENALAARIIRRSKKGRLKQRIERMENEVHQAMAVMDAESGKLFNYRQLMQSKKHKEIWSKSSANEFGRLANGVGGRIKGTNTIKFIYKRDVPSNRMKDVTYGQFVCVIRPEKAEIHRTRFVVGGNKINYPGEVATPTAEMLVAKLLFSSVISTPGARFMTMDISNFYLMTPLKRPEYVKLKLSDIPEEIIVEYKLRELATPDGSVYIEITKGMYGLPQAGLLANEQLEARLNKHGYKQSKLVPGLWRHSTRQIQFTLVVDDFGVKYIQQEDADHLKAVLEQDYTVTVDWSGRRYIGITLDWDYNRRRVHLSMPNYVNKALKLFGHKIRKQQHTPYPCAPVIYGAKVQYAKQKTTSPPVDAKTKKFIQQVCGKFLFLARAVDSTLLCPISAIASQSANPTEDTLEQTLLLLDYIGTQEEAVLTYNASPMVVAVHSDASYLSEQNARSRAGGHFFMSSDSTIPQNNGAVLNIAHIIKHVMSSATEAELAGLYIMAREAVYIRIILEELGHKQPPTPLQTDNSMAEAVINGKVQPKRNKAMDMRFHWLRDRECQEQFRIYWRPGKLNYADYWTKHHPTKHHQNIRQEFITPQIVLEMLRQEQAQVAAAAA